MRVTSQMLTTNMMHNINRNKINMNTKGDRYATGQAIQKPSDDPVIAVRTLKYRSQLTKIDQYLNTNIPEALSWMEITEEALDGVNSLIKNINTYCNQAVNGYYELTDRDSILATLEEYKDQIFELGNTDYAGRYVFTGYRTDTPLMFEAPTNAIGDGASWTTYNITEKLTYSNVTEKSYIVGGAEYDATGGTTADGYAAMAPSLESASRLQLSYGNIDTVKGVTLTNKAGETIEMSYSVADDGTITQVEKVTRADGSTTTTETVTKMDADGNWTEKNITKTVVGITNETRTEADGVVKVETTTTQVTETQRVPKKDQAGNIIGEDVVRSETSPATATAIETKTYLNGNITVADVPNATPKAVTSLALDYSIVNKSIAAYEDAKARLDKDAETLNPYAAGPNEVVYIKETGELILGSNVMASSAVYTDISVNFDKTEFAKGDIRPEHYFECSTDYYVNGTADSLEHVEYAEPGVQNIQYELNTNQKLTVNTLAKDALSTTVATKVDEIIRAVNSVFDIKDQIAEAKKTLQNTTTEDGKEAINSYIAQLETEEVLRMQVLTQTFESAITTTKEAQEETNVAVADIGARYIRAQLIESRLEEQETTVTELLSDIFYVDLEDAIVEYNAAQVYYNASLMCASTVVQQSLLDYLR